MQIKKKSFALEMSCLCEIHSETKQPFDKHMLHKTMLSRHKGKTLAQHIKDISFQSYTFGNNTQKIEQDPSAQRPQLHLYLITVTVP